MFNNTEAVIFDLDGTLVDSMWIWIDVDLKYLKKHGHDLPEDLQKQIEGMSTTEVAVFFKEKFNIEDDIEDMKNEWIEMAYEYYKSKIPMKDGAKEFILKLKEKGIKIGVGTSNFRDLAELVLKAHGVIEHVEALRTSCEVKRGKPSPDVFLKVAEDLKVNPKNCFVFEDTHAGVMAGNRAGMQVVAVYDESSKEYAEDIKNDVVVYINDYDEVLKLL